MHMKFHPNIEALVVFVLALFLMLSNIWGYPITILDEAKNAEAAREMLIGNHFLPTFNEALRTDKPPLHYFFMQLGFTIFGVNELGARFFGALLGAGFMTGFYLFLRRFSTLNIARLTTFILLSAFFWVQEFHLAVPDPYLLVFLCGAWLFFYAFWKSNEEKLIHSEPDSESSKNLGMPLCKQNETLIRRGEQGDNAKVLRNSMQNLFSSKKQFFSPTLKGEIDFFHTLQGWGNEKNQNMVQKTTNISTSHHNRSRQTPLWLFYIFLGLAILAKGPIAIGLSGLVVLIFLILKREFTWEKIWKYRPVMGGFLVFLIASPWFLWIHFQTDGAFTKGFFIQHNFSRFGGEMEGHGGIFLVTWAYVLLGLFPFGSFIPQGLWHGWKFLKRNDLAAFALIVSVVVIGFFSISSTKLPNYTLPAIPFLAILIAGFFEEMVTFQNSKKWWNTISLGLISLVSASIPAAIFILFDHPLIIKFQMPFVLLTSLMIGVGLYFIWKHYLNQNIAKWIMSVGILWITLGLLIFYLIYPNLAKIEPVSQASEIMQKNEIVVFESYDPSFNFNYERSFTVIHGVENLKKYLEQHPDVLILTKDKRIKDNKYFQENFQTVFNEPTVFENYRTVILKKW